VNAVAIEKYEPSLGLAFKIARLLGLPIKEIFQPLESTGGKKKYTCIHENRLEFRKCR
jgi:DNA-binding XRE family transcriptional regulator